ncbi:MAG: protein phosphatase 2C domain-containing protein [Magnetococcales bacterium]|nr:protein phosphatase 2C domain-containing protein [Magnetococcales bacterium]
MIHAAYAMVLGPRFRQEDCLLVDQKVVQNKEMVAPQWITVPQEQALFAVADGIGGGEAGDWASRSVCQAFASWNGVGVSTFLQQVQGQIATAAKPGYSPGSTLAGLLVDGEQVTAIGVGDSFVLRVGAAGIEPLNHPHSWVQGQLDKGHITPDEVKGHPYRNVITLGFGAAFAAAWGKGRPAPSIETHSWQPGEGFLICSDGLATVLEAADIDTLLEPLGLDAAQRLLERVRVTATDNAAFILLWR